MTDRRKEVVLRDDRCAPDPLEAAHRSVDEARAEIRRRLWFTPVAFLLVALVAFLIDDWIYVSMLVGLVGIGVVRLIGEMKEPRRYLRVPPRQLVGRILERREFWEARGKEPRDTGGLVQVQDLLDGLSLQESWLRRNNYRIAEWIGILAAAGWLVFAVIMLVAGEGAWATLVPLGMASLFGATAVSSARAESKRREAVELLEEVREDLASRSSSPPAELADT